MRVVRLGKRPVLGTEMRVTNNPVSGELISHRHLIIMGYHFCLAPKTKSETNPINLFYSLCRK